MRIEMLILALFAIDLAFLLTGAAPSASNALFTLLTNPLDLTSTGWFSTIFNVFTLSGIAIIVGALMFRVENLLWYGVASVFLGFMVQLTVLFTYISAQVSPVVAILVCAPIIMTYIMTVIAFARGRA